MTIGGVRRLFPGRYPVTGLHFTIYNVTGKVVPPLN
jgi:hypothetical protein